MLPTSPLTSLRVHALLLALLSSTVVSADDLVPFTSDGCSAFPDGIPLGTMQQQNLWLACCVEHDKAYWLGGSKDDRLIADEKLQACVSQVGEPDIAQLMLAGVRVGGSPFWPTSFRWGYGWPYWDGLLPRGYKTLNLKQKQQAKRLLFDQNIQTINVE